MCAERTPGCMGGARLAARRRRHSTAPWRPRGIPPIAGRRPALPQIAATRAGRTMAKAAARTEARLKELLREPANKRCIDCESLVRAPADRGLPARPPNQGSPAALLRRPAGPPVCGLQLQRVRVHRLQRRAVSAHALAPPAASAACSCPPRRAHALSACALAAVLQPSVRAPRQGRVHVHLQAGGGAGASRVGQRGAPGRRRTGGWLAQRDAAAKGWAALLVQGARSEGQAALPQLSRVC